MANWCDNLLYVTGSKKSLQKFLEACGEEFNLNALVPVPADITNSRVSQWCVENWGTKCDVGDSVTYVSNTFEMIEIRFTTAWSPPLAWVGKVSRYFPDLQFCIKYFEPGFGLAGEYHYKNGNEIAIPVEANTSEYIEFIRDNFDAGYELVA